MEEKKNELVATFGQKRPLTTPFTRCGIHKIIKV